MKYLFTSLLFIGLFSCDSIQSRQDDNLKYEISRLNNRIDSLILALEAKQRLSESSILPKPTFKKKKKGVVENTYSAYSSSERSSSASYASSRCQATTKKGSQCSRSPRSGSYCWQHGGWFSYYQNKHSYESTASAYMLIMFQFNLQPVIHSL